MNSNVFSLAALRRLSTAGDSVARSFERLSSGLRITRPSDDAAGLAVSSVLGAQQRIYSRAVANANDGISMLNIAQGSAEELSSVLTRLKELAQQSANGPLSGMQRIALDNEGQKLRYEYNRIIAATRFNGLTVHGADQGQTNIQLGVGSNAIVGFELGNGLETSVNNGSFVDTHVSTSTGRSVDGTIAADVNNDGFADILSFTTTQGRMRVALGNGDGTFKAGQVNNLLSGNARGFTTGDFNSDGYLDIAVGNSGGKINLFLNNRDGTFQTPVEFTADSGGTAITGIKAVDINNDNNVDIIVNGAKATGGTAYTLLGNGQGSLAAATSISTSFATSSSRLTTGDWNHDGWVDFATDSGSDSSIIIYTNQGSGNFTSSKVAGVASAQFLQSGDLNGDGYDEIIAASGSSLYSFSNVGGNFQTGQALATGLQTAIDLAVTDLNSDGFADILLSDSGKGKVWSQLGNGDGTFQTEISTDAPAGPTKFAFADFTGDGVLDFMIGAATNNIYLYQGYSRQSTNLNSFSLTTQSGARSAMNLFETQLNKIIGELGTIGAALSRISSATNVLGDTALNYAAAKSRIEDVDVASESAGLTRQRILQEASTSVLAQANLIPSLALKLLNF